MAPECLRQGWLKKQAPFTFKLLQKRFFILSADTLSYYKAMGDNEAKGAIPMNAVVALDHSVRVG